MPGLLRVADESGLVAALTAVQRRAVMRFANAADRDAQLLNPQLFDLVALADSKTWVWWDGAAWQPFGADTSLAQRVATLESQMSALTTRVTNVEARVTALEGRPAAPTWWGGVSAITTGTEGLATLTHNLGVVPQVVLAVAQYQVLGGGAITDVCDMEPGSMTSTTVKVRMANNHGDFLNSANLVVWWLAIAP